MFAVVKFSTDSNFTQQNVLTGGIIINAGSMHQDEDAVNQRTDIVRTSYLPLLDRLRAIPGVRVAALSSVLPLGAEFAVRIMGNLDHKEVPSAQIPKFDGRLTSLDLLMHWESLCCVGGSLSMMTLPLLLEGGAGRHRAGSGGGPLQSAIRFLHAVAGGNVPGNTLRPRRSGHAALV